MSAGAAPRGGPRGRDLTQGPITRTLAAFALPVLGSNVLQSVNGSINSLWVGRLLGEHALAATSNANLILFLVLGTTFGMGMAATILVAQAVGSKQLDRAKAVVGTSATFFLVFSALVAALGYALSDTILSALGTPADARPLANAYLRVIFIAIPAMNFLTFLMTILRGAGDARTPLAFMTLSVVLDIVLNPLLILGVGPFPEMGIAGAGASTLVAQVIALAAMLAVLYLRREPLRLTGPELRLLKPDLAILRTVLQKGGVMGLQMIVISTSGLLMMGLVNGYGVRTTAAYGVAAQLWAYVQMPALAIGAAVSSMTAQNVGAGRWDRVGRITRAGLGFNLVLTTAAAGLLVVFARPVMSLFLPQDPGAVAAAIHINSIGVWSFVPFGITIVLFATVRATGAVTPPLLILVVSLLVVRLAFGYALGPVLGSDAIWWAFIAGALVSLTLGTSYYASGRWRRSTLPVVRPPAGEAPDPGYGLPRGRALEAERPAGDGARSEVGTDP